MAERRSWQWIDASGEVRITAGPEGRAQALASGVPLLTKTYGPLREVEIVHADSELVRMLTGDVARLRAAVKALVDELPRCRFDMCASLATHSRLGEPSVCDAHADTNPPRGWAPDELLATAEPLRALLALLDEGSEKQ